MGRPALPCPAPHGAPVSHANAFFWAALAAFLAAAPAGAADTERAPGDIYQRALHATAWVHTQKRQGTGWLADAQRRLVVTDYHVVGPEQAVSVVFPDYRDGKVI